MYKLIAIDLDGTLLDDDKNVPKNNIDIINILKDKGYEVVFATGRRYLAAKEFIDFFEDDLVIIANNGNMVRHTSDDRLVSAEYLDNKHLEMVLRLGKKRDLHPIIHIDGFDEGIDMIGELPRDDKRYHNYVENEPRCKIVDDLLEEDLKILSIVYLGDYDELKKFEDEINITAPDNYTTYLMENIYLADALLEVINPVGSKWKSICDYAKSKGIKEEEIIAIGDDANDIEMIEKAGFGIAMKNGVAGILEVADMISEKDNNDAGLAEALKKVLKL